MTTETQVAQPPRALDGRQLPGDGWSPRLHSCAPGVLEKAHLAFLKRTKTPPSLPLRANIMQQHILKQGTNQEL